MQTLIKQTPITNQSKKHEKEKKISGKASESRRLIPEKSLDLHWRRGRVRRLIDRAAPETGKRHRKGPIFGGASAPERAVFGEIPAGLNARAAVAVAMRALATFWEAKMRVARRRKKKERKRLDGPEVHWMGRRTLSSVLSFVSLEVYSYSFPDLDGECFGKPDRTGPDRTNCCVINMNEASLQSLLPDSQVIGPARISP